MIQMLLALMLFGVHVYAENISPISPKVIVNPLGIGWHMLSPSIGQTTMVDEWLLSSGLSDISTLFTWQENAFKVWPQSLASEYSLEPLNSLEPGNAVIFSLPEARIMTHDFRTVSRGTISITTPGWHLISPLIRENISPAQLIATSIVSDHSFTAIDRIFSYQDGTWKRFVTAKQNEADLTELRPGQGFWIYAKEVDGKTISPQNPLILKPVGEIQNNLLLSLWVEDKEGETFFHALMESKANQNLAFHLSVREPYEVADAEFVPIHSFPLLTLETNPKTPGLLGDLSSLEAGVIQSSWLWDTGRDFVGTEPAQMELLLEVKTETESVDLANLTTVVPNPGVIMRMPYLLPGDRIGYAAVTNGSNIYIHGGCNERFYDEVTGTFPWPRANSRHHDNLMAYSPATHNYDFIAHGASRCGHALAVKDNKLFAISGHTAKTGRPHSSSALTYLLSVESMTLPTNEQELGFWETEFQLPEQISRPVVNWNANNLEIISPRFSKKFSYSELGWHEELLPQSIIRHQPVEGTYCGGFIALLNDNTSPPPLQGSIEIELLSSQTNVIVHTLDVPVEALKGYSLHQTAVACSNNDLLISGGSIRSDIFLRLDLNSLEFTLMPFPKHIASGSDASYRAVKGTDADPTGSLYFLRTEESFQGIAVDVFRPGPARITALKPNQRSLVVEPSGGLNVTVSGNIQDGEPILLTVSSGPHRPFILLENDAYQNLSLSEGAYEVTIDPSYAILGNASGLNFRNLLASGDRISESAFAQSPKRWSSRLMAIPYRFISLPQNAKPVPVTNQNRIVYISPPKVPSNASFDFSGSIRIHDFAFSQNDGQTPNITAQSINLGNGRINSSQIGPMALDQNILYLYGTGANGQGFYKIDLQKSKVIKLPDGFFSASQVNLFGHQGLIHAIVTDSNDNTQNRWYRFNKNNDYWLPSFTTFTNQEMLGKYFTDQTYAYRWSGSANSSIEIFDIPSAQTLVKSKGPVLITDVHPIGPIAVSTETLGKFYGLSNTNLSEVKGLVELNLNNLRQRVIEVGNLPVYDTSVLYSQGNFYVAGKALEPIKDNDAYIFQVPLQTAHQPVGAELVLDDSTIPEQVEIRFRPNINGNQLDSFKTLISADGINYQEIEGSEISYNAENDLFHLILRTQEFPFSTNEGFVRVIAEDETVLLQHNGIRMIGTQPLINLCQVPELDPVSGSTLNSHNQNIQIFFPNTELNPLLSINGISYPVTASGANYNATVALRSGGNWGELLWDGCSFDFEYNLASSEAMQIQILEVKNRTFSPLSPIAKMPVMKFSSNVSLQDITLYAEQEEDLIFQDVGYSTFNSHQPDQFDTPGTYSIRIWEPSFGGKPEGDIAMKIKFKDVLGQETEKSLVLRAIY